MICLMWGLWLRRQRCHLSGVEDDQQPAWSDVNRAVVASCYMQSRFEIGARHR